DQPVAQLLRQGGLLRLDQAAEASAPQEARQPQRRLQPALGVLADVEQHPLVKALAGGLELRDELEEGRALLRAGLRVDLLQSLALPAPLQHAQDGAAAGLVRELVEQHLDEEA